MKRLTLIAALLFAAIFSAAAPLDAAEKATARIEKVTIPTFEMEAPDTAPGVFELDEWYRAYPRSFFRVYTRAADPVDKEYDMAVVENSLLRVEVLPEVGGRIWRIIDKTTGRNLLWTNDAVKPIRVGRRRGWLAGGIEFPFPVSNHGEDTMEPYRFRLDENEDGSASVTVASFDHFYRFHGSYTMALAPGEARLAVTVRLYNPTEVRNPYQIWVNAAVKTGNDMQFIFPVDYVAGHGFGGVYEWPNMGRGRDASYYRNTPGQLGVFGWDADFLGAYFHDDDWGIIRYSSKDFTRGIKLWTWGTRSGWTDEYSINQGSYNEIQGGRWPTQTMNGYLEPHRMDTWTEYWYPVNGLGGVDAATPDAVLTATFAADDSALVRLNVLRPVSGKLEIEAAGKVLLSKSIDALPGKVIQEVVQPGDIGEEPLKVTLKDGANFTLISYDAYKQRKRGPKQDVPKSVDLEGEGPLWDRLEQALVTELDEVDWVGAERQYRQIVAEDPTFAPAWKALGILLYRQMDLEGARDALKKAANYTDYDPEALYYLGVVQLALGDKEALDILAAVSDDVTFTHTAKYLIGREALKAGDHAAAVKSLESAARGWSGDCILWDTLAVAQRLSENKAAAAEALNAALAANPLDPFAQVERLFLDGSPSEDALKALLGTDDDLYIETALFYDAVNRPEEALLVAQAGAPSATSGLHHYYLSYFAGRCGKTDLAAKHAEKALEMGNDYVFPHRPEALGALDYVANLSRNEGAPLYHRGIMLYWLGRQEEAVALWESLIGRYKVPGLYKNVAVAYSRGQIAKDLASSIDLYHKAIEEDSQDVSLYYDLDDLYEQAGARGERRDALEKARELFPDDDQILLRYVLALGERRDGYARAAEILETHQFKRAHQTRELMQLGYRAITETYCGLAMEALRNRNRDKALEYLEKAASARETLRAWFD